MLNNFFQIFSLGKFHQVVSHHVQPDPAETRGRAEQEARGCLPRGRHQRKRKNHSRTNDQNIRSQRCRRLVTVINC